MIGSNKSHMSHMCVEGFVMIYTRYGQSTLPKTNIAPENRLSQKEIRIPTIHLQVLS